MSSSSIDGMQKQNRIEYYPLANKVLVVAVEGSIKDWACYIGAVEGENYDKEFLSVARSGAKIQYEIAKILFTEWDIIFTWRP